MNILVTGSTGFLGTALCKALERNGDNITKLNSRNCDLTDGRAPHKFNDRRYDRIYHLAAWTQAGDFCLTHPGEQWIINQQINTNVLNFWREHQAQAKLISIGTSCAYDPNSPLTEEYYLTGTPIDSLFTYAMTKRMLHVGQLALAKQYNLKFLTVIPSTLYGPDYHVDGRQMHFIFDLVRKILRGKYYGEPVQLWGDGHQKRELILIDDFLKSLLYLSGTVDNDIVNIGAGRERSIREFAGTICRLAGYDVEAISYDPNRYVGARNKCLRIEKLKSLQPDLEFTPLETGLRQTIDWFITNRAKLLPAPAKKEAA